MATYNKKRNHSRMKKRTLTLIEMMIVILLITLVTGVIGYNMKGALDRGKAFRTETAREKLYDLMTLIVSEQSEWSLIRLAGLDLKDLGEKLKTTGLVQNPDDVLKDGWGHYFILEPSTDKKDIRIVSSWYANYQERLKDKSTKKEDKEDDNF